MKAQYKKHLSHPMGIWALCGSHTSAKKFTLEKWLEFAASERCPKCETVQKMGVSDPARKRATLSA